MRFWLNRREDRYWRVDLHEPRYGQHWSLCQRLDELSMRLGDRAAEVFGAQRLPNGCLVFDGPDRYDDVDAWLRALEVEASLVSPHASIEDAACEKVRQSLRAFLGQKPTTHTHEKMKSVVLQTLSENGWEDYEVMVTPLARTGLVPDFDVKLVRRGK